SHGRAIGRVIFPSFHKWIWLFRPTVVENGIGPSTALETWPTLRPRSQHFDRLPCLRIETSPTGIEMGDDCGPHARVPDPGDVPNDLWSGSFRRCRGFTKISRPSSRATATSVIPNTPAAPRASAASADTASKT